MTPQPLTVLNQRLNLGQAVHASRSIPQLKRRLADAQLKATLAQRASVDSFLPAPALQKHGLGHWRACQRQAHSLELELKMRESAPVRVVTRCWQTVFGTLRPSDPAFGLGVWSALSAVPALAGVFYGVCLGGVWGALEGVVSYAVAPPGKPFWEHFEETSSLRALGGVAVLGAVGGAISAVLMTIGAYIGALPLVLTQVAATSMAACGSLIGALRRTAPDPVAYAYTDDGKLFTEASTIGNWDARALADVLVERAKDPAGEKHFGRRPKDNVNIGNRDLTPAELARLVLYPGWRDFDRAELLDAILQLPSTAQVREHESEELSLASCVAQVSTLISKKFLASANETSDESLPSKLSTMAPESWVPSLSKIESERTQAEIARDMAEASQSVNLGRAPLPGETIMTKHKRNESAIGVLRQAAPNGSKLMMLLGTQVRTLGRDMVAIFGQANARSVSTEINGRVVDVSVNLKLDLVARERPATTVEQQHRLPWQGETSGVSPLTLAC